MGSCSLSFFVGCLFIAIPTMVECAGRTKVEGIEDPEKEIQLHETSWRSDSSSSPGNNMVARRLTEQHTQHERNQQPPPSLESKCITYPVSLTLILVFHFVTKNSITPA